MKVLVTGASGFSGGAVVRALVKARLEVRVIARNGSDTRHLTDLPVAQVEGDLRTRGSLVRAQSVGAELLLEMLNLSERHELMQSEIEAIRESH